MISNLAKQGRPEGGSTITQQVVKNLLVGDDVTYERKMREVILASRVEHTLGKSEILETYLNTIYLGRGCPHLFRQAGVGPDADRRRDARRASQGPDLLQSGPAS